MKDLILYFSASHNTEKFAKIIQEKTNGDLIQIEPEKPYSRWFMFRTIRAKKEADKKIMPEFKKVNINLDEYDRVFIGYPIWWYTMPMIIYNFLEKYDLSGKTIVPFNTHEGSGSGGTYKTIQELVPNAKVLEGLPIQGAAMKFNQSKKINEWIDGLHE